MTQEGLHKVMLEVAHILTVTVLIVQVTKQVCFSIALHLLRQVLMQLQ